MTRVATARSAAAKPYDVEPAEAAHAAGRPSLAQRDWLKRGLDQPGGKLPLFDRDGKRVGDRTIRACIEQGWAQPWFANPMKPDWLVCKLTAAGRKLVAGG
ncbi:MAG: hypothetical protein ACT4N4_14765 [Rhodospirillales bacterium]